MNYQCDFIFSKTDLLDQHHWEEKMVLQNSLLSSHDSEMSLQNEQITYKNEQLGSAVKVLINREKIKQ